jgi:hypothetical protein
MTSAARATSSGPARPAVGVAPAAWLLTFAEEWGPVLPL